MKVGQHLQFGKLSTKNTVGKDEYRLRGGEVIIEVDLKTQTSKITDWGE